MKWYEGALLYKLENVHIASDLNFVDCGFPIQTVIRPHTLYNQDFRGLQGVLTGRFKPSDKVKTLPSGCLND